MLFALLAGASTRAADTGLASLLETTNWPLAYPPLKFPGPVIESIKDIDSKGDGFSLTVSFLKEGSEIKGLRNGDHPEKILGMAMTNLFVIRLQDENDKDVDIHIVNVHPPQLSREVDTYKISARFGTIPNGTNRRYKVTVSNRYRLRQDIFRSRQAYWTSNAIPSVITALEKLGRSTNELIAPLIGIQSTKPNDPNRRAFSEITAASLRKYFNFSSNTNGLANQGSIAGSITNMTYLKYLGAFEDDITIVLYTKLSEIESWIAKLKINPDTSAPQWLTADTCEELFWLLAYRYHRFNGGFPSGKQAEEEVRPSSLSEKFEWTGRISGFGVLVEKLESLPEKEVASNFGRGIANHFHVFRVALLNTNASSVLVYGDQISLKCKAQEFTFSEPKDFKKLISSVPSRDLHIISIGENDSRRIWKTSKEGNGRGIVREMPANLLARPYTLNFLIRGYEDREFNTTKARVFRSISVIGDTAAALIPFIGKQGYSDGSGLFSGVFVPGTKKLFGDSTEVQRQTFLLESMPPYVEIETGQSISKYIYFPKYGLTGVKQDKVVFLTEFGDALSMEVRVAYLVKSGSGNSATSSGTTSNTQP